MANEREHEQRDLREPGEQTESLEAASSTEGIGDLEEAPLRELSDLAAEDLAEAEVEEAADSGAEADDVFAENVEYAYEARAEMAQPDTFVTTAEGELRDASDVMPDTAIVEPLVQGDTTTGEAAIGGAASTPSVADHDVDAASAHIGDDAANEGEESAPFSEVTPDEWEQ